MTGVAHLLTQSSSGTIPPQGQSWEVRVTAVTDPQLSVEVLEPLRAALATKQQAGNVGLSTGRRGTIAITVVLVVGEKRPGRALDEAVAVIADALARQGVSITFIQEAAVVPGWRDERDW